MIAAAVLLMLAGGQVQPAVPVSASAAAADPVAPFVLVAQAEDMVSRCAQLDRAASRGTRLRRARAAVADLSARSGAAGRGDLLSRGWQRWTAMRDGVDTSCIVGPGETDRTAYAALVGGLERAVREAATTLPATGRGRR